MLDICICEDEVVSRQKMANLVSNYCMISELDASLVLVTENPTWVLEFFKSATNPVLFFLDIDLGAEIDGMKLAQKIRELNKESFIVFFTTKSEMAPMTFKYQLEALDFIVKDADEDEIKSRIRSSINTAVKRHLKTTTSQILQIKHDDKVILLPMEDILYIETTGTRYKLNLHTEKRRISMNGELKKVQQELDERFIRCHQSYLVNGDHIAECNFKNQELTLSDGSVISMSRSGKKLLKLIINQL